MVRFGSGPRWRRSAQVGAIALGTGCLSAWFGLALSGSSAVAAGVCTDPGVPGSGMVISINTTTGCDQSGGQALFPITGYVAAKEAASTTYQVFPGYEALSAHKFYWGSYTLSFTCTVGSGTSSSSLTITEGTGSYPGTPPSHTGTLPTLTTDASGGVDCAYSLTVQHEPSVTGTGSDKINSSKLDLWLENGGDFVDHAATESVKPPTIPTTTPTPTGSTPTPTPTGSTPTPTPTGSTPTPTPTGSTPTPTPTGSTPTPTPTGSTPTPTPTESTPTPTPAATPTPTATPATGVQGISTTTSTTTSTTSGGGGVGGITTPNTGAGGSGTGSLALLLSGLFLLTSGALLSKRRKA